MGRLQPVAPSAPAACREPLPDIGLVSTY